MTSPNLTGHSDVVYRHSTWEILEQLLQKCSKNQVVNVQCKLRCELSMTSVSRSHMKIVQTQYMTGWWFQLFFSFISFIPIWGNDPI